MSEEIKFNQRDIIEFNVDKKNEVIVHRLFFGKTERDNNIENLAVPKRPFWLYILVKSLRFYQKHISSKLGNRCVFDPSCSHYSERAFREKGIKKGFLLTVKRLNRCRSSNGGIDELI